LATCPTLNRQKMGYRNLLECVRDLEAKRELVRISAPIDPHLEMAEIQRRVFRAEGPALLFTNPKNCSFPMLANLFGTPQRARYLFRDTLEGIKRLMKLKVDPLDLLRRPLSHVKTPWMAWHTLPKRVRRGPVLECQTTIDQLPQLQSWPDDGGAYVTLPQVYTEDPRHPGMLRSNLGMYRVQLSGNQYERNREVGLHYQIHRGIGVHHAAALELKKPLRVNVFVGGPPAMALAAVMPLPEGLSEVAFAGALGGRRVPMIAACDRRLLPEYRLPIHAEADFCISGYIDPGRQLPEGPFGDHLGYYSLAHDFPVMIVERVYHRKDAIWPFTVVGRPPQEDSMFGELIHEMVESVLPGTIPGVRAVHAVEASGVHPLLLAIGSERYVPYEGRPRPRELLTQSNAVLGQGQLSLAKYLLIVAGEDNPGLDIRDVRGFFRHVLERVDWRRDLHFQTCTTIDTLDYSGEGLNQGSKVVIAAAGPPLRTLPSAIDSGLALPEAMGFRRPTVVLPGILVIEGPTWEQGAGSGEQGAGPDRAIERFCQAWNRGDAINNFPLVVVVDQAEFVARNIDNFLWTTFTRSNPATDIYGIEAFIRDKHWGCFGAVVIDARAKPHHAPPLVEDPEVTRRVDALAAPGGPLHGIC
jgi:4-hydroxy-3-polyprenylbenzoate decarboxylase